MNKLLLQQHFFGSVPAGHGLTGNRGFQTIGRSAGAGEERFLEEHCDYEPPEDYVGGSLPVNWGWFELDDGRACLHRIGDAGTDEIGRTGNFLAHNLITTAAELEAIDYDIPALFRWVSERSPIRYPTDTGREDGFASYPSQVNERFGTEPERLGAIPPLEVSLAQVLTIRDRMDRQLGAETVSLLRASLGRGGVGALLAAFLCPPEARRPVVVCGIGGDSENEAAQRCLAEFLFAVLPYHYRRRLTYATYSHRLPTADDLLSSAPAHRRRRLVVPGPGVDGAAGVGRRGNAAWIVGGNGLRHQVPEPPAKLARQYEEWLDRDSGLSRILAGRSIAGHFAFNEELHGLQDGWRWAALCKGAEFGLGEVELFARTAPVVRDAWPEVVAAGSRAVASLATRTEIADQLFPGVVTGYLCGVGRVLPGMPAGVREQYYSSVNDDLAGLLSLTVAMERWEQMRELIAGVCDGPAFASVRPQALAGLSATLEQRLVGDNPERLAAAWTALSEGSEPGTADSHVRAFRVRAASHLMRLLLSRRMKQRSDRLASVLDSLIIPVLLEAPFAAPDELLDRFAFLEEVSGENRARSCGRFIVELSRRGSLDSDVIGRIARDYRSLVLRFCEAWKEAAQVAPAKLGPIQSLIEEPQLVATYWRTPWRERDPLMDRGLLTLLADYHSAAQRERAHRLFLLYAHEGGASMMRDLQEDDRTRFPAELSIMADAHCALIDTVVVGDREVMPSAQDHLSRLLAHLLTVPLAKASDPGAIRGIIERPAEQALSWFPGVESRTRLFEEAARSVHRFCAATRPPVGRSTDRLLVFQEALVDFGIDLAEAWWHTERFRIASEPVAESGTRERSSRSIFTHASANLLLEFPELSTGDRQGEFAHYLQRRLDQAAWAELSRRLVVECGGRDRKQAAMRWFAPESPRGALLDRLEREGWLDKAIDAMLEDLSNVKPADVAILGLEELLALGPRDAVAEPARCRLLDLVTRRLDGLVPANTVAPTRLPSRAEAVRDIALCPPVLRLGILLGRVRVERLWSRLGHCLAVLEPTDIHRVFPAIFALGCRLSESLSEERKLWMDLFRPTFSLANRPQALQNFVACGDSLHIAPGGSLRTVEQVEKFAALHHDTEFRTWLYADLQNTGYAVANYTTTDLFDVLSKAPRAESEFETASLIAGRARLGAMIYCPNHLPVLAILYLELGLRGRSHWMASGSAAAPWGFLTLRGTNAVNLKEQVGVLLDKRFWKLFKGRCEKSERQELCDLLEGLLMHNGVGSKEANQITEQLRRGMQNWLRRAFGQRTHKALWRH